MFSILEIILMFSALYSLRTSLIAIISSVVGLELGLFFIYPFVISLLLLMGYDKLTALTATLGATVVGIYGSTLSGVMYSVSNSITERSTTL